MGMEKEGMESLLNTAYDGVGVENDADFDIVNIEVNR